MAKDKAATLEDTAARDAFYVSLLPCVGMADALRGTMTADVPGAHALFLSGLQKMPACEAIVRATLAP
jgi:hypothetical protein